MIIPLFVQIGKTYENRIGYMDNFTDYTEDSLQIVYLHASIYGLNSLKERSRT